MTATATAFELDDVRLDYGPDRGLHGVSLSAPEGQVIGLLGASGAGKSTLLRVLATLAPIDSGALRVGETPVDDPPRRTLRSLRQRVGLMHQHGQLIDGLRVFHNVAIGRLSRWSTARSLLNLMWPQRPAIEAVHDALDRVELGDRLWDWPQRLSGGERQRVAMARLLLQDPALWLADEPAAGLDPRLRRSLLHMLVGLVRDRDGTLVVSAHDVDLVDDQFDRVIGLRHGQVMFDGPPATLTPERVTELYAA